MIFKYKGYTLSQAEEINHHFMIFNPEGKMCMHASHEGDLFTQEQAEEMIDFYLGFMMPNGLIEEHDND